MVKELRRLSSKHDKIEYGLLELNCISEFATETNHILRIGDDQRP